MNEQLQHSQDTFLDPLVFTTKEGSRVYFERFFPGFLVRDDASSADQRCTHWVQVGTWLSLCVGEAHFICQHPNLINN
jgi:hypothetical protein